MSSFRRPKSEAALRLYNLPRRELQALCKQYGIPANKTNVAMADALCACIPADNIKPKASAGSSLGVSKTTPMKLKLDKKIGLPETSLAAFILTGKRKTSPMKLAEQPAEVEEVAFPKPNTTPLKRGVKRSERPVEALEEKSKVAAVPAFTRAVALQDRFGKAASATQQAVSSPKPPVPTPRKRAAEAAAVVTRRGGDALPPVSFYDLVSTPKKSQVHEITELNSTGKTANKMRTRLGLRTGPQEDESTLPLSRKKVSKGKRVAFADEVELQKSASPEPEPQEEPEMETETIEISYAEIEFKDAAIHKELFGSQRNITMEEKQDVAPAPKEELENREDAPDSTQEAALEFRGMALHQEILGSHGNNQLKCDEAVFSPLDLQQAGTSASAVESESMELRISPMSSPAEVFNNSDTVPVQDHSVPPGICEDVCVGSDGQGEALEEHTEQHLAQGCDSSPLLDDVSCNNLAANPCEESSEAPDRSHVTSPGCLTAEIQCDTKLTLEQDPSLVSSSADVHVIIDEERDFGDTQRHQEENHDVSMLVDGLTNESLDEQSSQETLESSVPVLDEGQKSHSGPALEFDEVQSFPQELVEKEKSQTSPSVASAKNVLVAGPELVMSGTSVSNIPVTPAAHIHDYSVKRLSGPGSSNIPVTPAANVQDNSAKRLSGPGIFNIPVTPAANLQNNSAKRLSGSGGSSISVTPAANIQDNSAKRLSGLRSSDIPVTPVTKLQDNDSALAMAATPLSKIQSNIDSTLAKATSILEKLAAWRADAEKKMREGFWEPKFSTVVESASAAAEVKKPLEKPIAKSVFPVDRDIPSAKKARTAPKPILGPEKALTVCEDTNVVSEADLPSAKKMRVSDESKDSSEVSDKENQSDKSIEDKSSRKMGGLGKDKKKHGKKFEVLKDRSKNLPDHGGALATIKESTGVIRPGDLSLRKLRAQVKQKVSQLETSKASPLTSQKAWNTSH